MTTSAASSSAKTDTVDSVISKANETVTLPPNVSIDQLRDVLDVLRQPLTGRTVLIPFGPRAFYAGRLCPDTIQDDHATTHEIVRIVSPPNDNNNAHEPQQVTRQQAREMLQEEIRNRSQSKKITKSSASAITSPLDSTLTKDGTNQQEVTSHNKVPLKLFEIREELDDQGKEVRAEALNVSNEVNYLQEQMGGEKDMLDATSFDTNDHSKTVLSDTEYDKVAARLDELARLEEEADQNKSVNLKSRKKFQGKGWSKGFLDTAATKKTKSQKTQTSQVKNETKNSLNLSKSEDVEKRKVVSFDLASDQVQEIPRAGSDQNPRYSEPRPFDETVIGAVKERKMLRRKQNAIVKPMMSEQPSQPMSFSTESEKPMSKFSLERRQLHQF